jgi:hypothetical protein
MRFFVILISLCLLPISALGQSHLTDDRACRSHHGPSDCVDGWTVCADGAETRFRCWDHNVSDPTPAHRQVFISRSDLSEMQMRTYSSTARPATVTNEEIEAMRRFRTTARRDPCIGALSWSHERAVCRALQDREGAEVVEARLAELRAGPVHATSQDPENPSPTIVLPPSDKALGLDEKGKPVTFVP